MSDLLNIGASGVRAYQSALTTTSSNIANVGNAGYVRRTATLTEIGAGPSRLRSGGLGVAVTGSGRAGDQFRATEARNASAELSKSETGVVWLERIDSSLTQYQLGERLTGFFNAATALAADPAGAAPRSVMFESAEALATAFNGTLDALDESRATLDQTANLAATELSNLAAGLAKVNVGLGGIMPDTPGQAQLLDERDRILDAMGALTDITPTFDANGRAAVRSGGPNGPLLVLGDTAATVSFDRNDEGAVAFIASRGNNVSVLSPSGGTMAGMGEGAQRIADMRAQTADLAQRFAAGVNAVQESGVDRSDMPGTAMFAVGGDGRLSVAIAGPDAIAAGKAGGGARDNSNLADLATLRTDAGFEREATAMVTSNGAVLSGKRTVVTVQTAIRDNAVAARDAVQGVNIDEEAVDLIRFQQAYQASSRVIQVARDTLQTMLDIR